MLKWDNKRPNGLTVAKNSVPSYTFILFYTLYYNKTDELKIAVIKIDTICVKLNYL